MSYYFDQWTDEEKANAMAELVTSRGWVFLKHLLTTEERAKAQLELNTNDHEDLAKVRNLQFQITLIDELLEKPHNIIKKVYEEPEDPSVLLDPYYDKVEDINKKST